MSTSTFFLWNFDWNWSLSSKRHFEKKIIFISCPVSDVWRHSETSFCHFSLILPLNSRFKPWNLVFRKSRSWLKFFDMIRGKLWKKFHTMPHIRHMTSFVYVILLMFSNYITWLLFQLLRNVFSNEDDDWSCSTWSENHSENDMFLVIFLVFNLGRHT